MKMLRRLTLTLLTMATWGAVTASQAGTGLMELPGLLGDGPITVFYPSSSADEPVQRGPFQLQLAWQGSPVRGNGRLIVITHGSGGNPWVHTDLARAMVAAGFVVALPEHAGDNSKDPSTPGPESWKRRPAEVSAPSKPWPKTTAWPRCSPWTRWGSSVVPPVATRR